jgi:hypothetical protein
LFISSHVQSQDSLNDSASKLSFSLSFIDYPNVSEYVELIESIYTEIGFRVRLIPVPPSRGLILLNEGKVDADVVRLKASIMKLPNILIVNPAIQEAELSMICLKDTICICSSYYQ